MALLFNFLTGQASRIVAIVLIFFSYQMARLPELPDAERAALRSRFAFKTSTLPELSGYPSRTLRSVHPGLARNVAWISTVGAAVALHDLDGDGLPNDVCYVDTRINQVVIAAAPGTPPRYQPFALDPAPLAYDAATTAPMGCLPGDFNEDSAADLLVYYWGRTPILFLKQGQATGDALSSASYARRELTTSREIWNTNAASLADVDGDGHVDILIGNYFPDGMRVLDHSATDGAEMQRSMSRAYNGGRNRLFLWAGATATEQPDARFKEQVGAFDDYGGSGWTLALGAADLDGDLLPEIYIANDFGPDRLLHNRSQPGAPAFALLEGKRTLTTPHSKVLGRDSFKGMGVDFGDMNGDGLLDIYVSNIAAEFALEESHFLYASTGKLDQMKQGIAPYEDQSEPLGLSRSGWGWDSRLDDFDNDGTLEALQATGFLKGTVNRWPELHELAMSNDTLLDKTRHWPEFHPGDDLSGHQHDPFFVRASDGRYYDLAEDIGIARPVVSRGIATADVDGDGRQDYAVAHQWAASSFYHNRSASGDQFLGLHLRLPVEPMSTTVTPGHLQAAGRPAIGAEATVYLPDGRTLVEQVDGGNGHSGKRSPDLHFGLGQLTPDTPVRVDLRWRTPRGETRSETLTLTPGWHTVQLGW
ncbi:MAG TPA: CRTAC1 family protein [Herpetosiphonaceae bacterium]